MSSPSITLQHNLQTNDPTKIFLISDKQLPPNWIFLFFLLPASWKLIWPHLLLVACIFRHQTVTEVTGTTNLFQEIPHNIKILIDLDVSLLGVPIKDSSMEPTFENKVQNIHLMKERLTCLEPHQTLTLLKKNTGMHFVPSTDSYGQLRNERMEEKSWGLWIVIEASCKHSISDNNFICSLYELLGWCLNLPCKPISSDHRVSRGNGNVQGAKWWNWGSSERVQSQVVKLGWTHDYNLLQETGVKYLSDLKSKIIRSISTWLGYVGPGDCCSFSWNTFGYRFLNSSNCSQDFSCGMWTMWLQVWSHVYYLRPPLPGLQV